MTNYQDKIPFWPNSKCSLSTNVIECDIQTHVWKETNEITGILVINLYISSVWFVTGIISSTRQTTFTFELEFQEECVIIELTMSFLWTPPQKMNRDFTRSGGKQNASYMVNRQCVIYLNGDIDSSCGSLSREDLMLFGIPRWVVPLLISCDSSVRDVQMTVF